MSLPDFIGSSIHVIFSSFGLVVNILLIYVVFKCSPKNVQTYSIMLLNFAFTDATCCTLELLLQMRTIPYLDNILYVPNGICARFGAKVCWFLYTCLLCLYSHCNYSLLASFLFRLYVLYFPVPSRTSLFIFLLFIFSPTIFQFSILLPYGMSQWNTNFTELMGNIYPEFASPDVTIFGSAHVGNDWRATIASVQLILPIFPVTIIVLILRSWILWKLKKHSMSEGMKRLHKSLLKALTLQMLLPIFYIIGSVFYIIAQFTTIHGPLFEYGIYVSMGVIPALSPLFPLYFITPYHDWIRVKLFRTTQSVGPSYSATKENNGTNQTNQSNGTNVSNGQDGTRSAT